MSKDTQYSSLIGRKLRVDADLYLLKFSSATPSVLGNAASVSSALPEEVSDSHVGKTFGEIEVESIVPAGTEVTIKAVTKAINTPPEFLGTIGEREVDLSFVQDYSGLEVGFRPSTLTPLSR